jgi:glycosyltransferase involved in cell wall biosynthesis
VYVVYDHQIFGWQEYGGISRYFFEVAKRIHAFDGYEVEIFSPLFVNKYLKNDSTLRVRGRYVRRLPKTTRIIQGVNARLVQSMLRKTAPDIVHETYYQDRKLASGRTKTTVTVYDMTHEKFPQFFTSREKTSERKKAAVHRADHVICISENTRSDLIELFGIDSEKTSVTYLAVSPVDTRKSQVQPVVDRPYIAYVGLRSLYKNFSGLLQAFGASEFLRSNFSIVCVGGEPFTWRDREQIERFHLKRDQVLHIKGGDDMLAAVYRDAAVFVYPSLYEGFGLPPLEAMSASCPVACSDTSSLPEICGEAAEYFDPTSPESIAAAIERVVTSPTLRHGLITLGLERIKNFGWDICATQTASVYRQLV